MNTAEDGGFYTSMADVVSCGRDGWKGVYPSIMPATRAAPCSEFPILFDLPAPKYRQSFITVVLMRQTSESSPSSQASQQ